MDPDQQLRNLRDFLLVYNRMTEICFQRCSSNFNYRNLTMDEERCVDSCAGKLIRANHRLMGTYVQLMPKMVQRRMEEMESKAAQNAKAAEAAAASADVAPPATEAIVASQNPITSSLSTQEPPQLTPSVADVRSEAHGPFLAPAGLDAPVDLNPPVSNSTTTPEVILPAAATLTNVSEPVYPSVLNDTGNGPSYRTGSPQSPIAGAQTEFESSVPVLMPSKPTSISADGPVATVAAPTVSTESLSGQERAPELPPMSNQ